MNKENVIVQEVIERKKINELENINSENKKINEIDNILSSDNEGNLKTLERQYFQDIIFQKILNVLDLEILSETAGTPVGEIISYMGVNVPLNYLKCDGTEYNINDYPYLTQHFLENFGSINFFGGDGETTFAVPDLRGEFLRGAGGTASLTSGAGGNVGEHQDPTIDASHPTNIGAGGVIFAAATDSENRFKKNPDASVPTEDTSHYANFSGTKASGPFSWQTSRLTNTSVLYCIKYRPTYFSNIKINQ